MRSALRFAIFSLSGLLILHLASPGFAQGLPATSDPFAGVPAVDGAHMSEVSGQPGATGLPSAANPENGSDCGIACGTDSAISLVTPGTQQVTTG